MDILNDVVLAYNTQTTAWFNQLLPTARTIFFLLAAIELAWILTGGALLGSDAFWGRLLRRIVALTFFNALLTLYPDYLPMLTIGLADVGQQTVGFFNLNPGEILDQGISLALEIFLGLNTLELAFPMARAILLVPFFSVLIAFGMMAVQVMRLLIEQYLVLGTGVFFFSFSASRWTFALAEGLVRYSIQVGVRLFMIAILIGIGRSFAADWAQALDHLNPLVTLRSYLHVSVASLAFAMLVWTLPDRVASAVAGGFSLGNPYRDDG